MPAISAATHPITAIVTSTAASGGKAGNSAENSGSSFSSVLANRTASTSEPQAKQATSSSSTKNSDSKAEAKQSNRDDDTPDNSAASSPTAPTDTSPIRNEVKTDTETDPVAAAVMALMAASAPAVATSTDPSAPVDRAKNSLTKMASPVATVALPAIASSDVTLSGDATQPQAKATELAGKGSGTFAEILVPTAKVAASGEENKAANIANSPVTSDLSGSAIGAAPISLATKSAQTANATSMVPSVSHAAEYSISTPMGSSSWSSAVGNSIALISSAGQQRAELVLTPPELGRIHVAVSMKGDEASATFISPNPVVRDALENALPRLREILADAGITLGQAQVGAESHRESTANRQSGDNATFAAATGNTSDEGVSAAIRQVGQRATVRSLVDTYA